MGIFNRVYVILSEKNDAPLIMISSARVFSGSKNVPYAEMDVPDSTDPYAQALIEAESIVLNNLRILCCERVGLFSGARR